MCIYNVYIYDVNDVYHTDVGSLRAYRQKARKKKYHMVSCVSVYGTPITIPGKPWQPPYQPPILVRKAVVEDLQTEMIKLWEWFQSIYKVIIGTKH